MLDQCIFLLFSWRRGIVEHLLILPSRPREHSEHIDAIGARLWIMGIVIRDDDTNDYSECRRLWAELTEHHRRIYGDPSIGGADPGSDSTHTSRRQSASSPGWRNQEVWSWA